MYSNIYKGKYLSWLTKNEQKMPHLPSKTNKWQTYIYTAKIVYILTIYAKHMVLFCCSLNRFSCLLLFIPVCLLHTHINNTHFVRRIFKVLNFAHGCYLATVMAQVDRKLQFISLLDISFSFVECNGELYNRNFFCTTPSQLTCTIEKYVINIIFVI